MGSRFLNIVYTYMYKYKSKIHISHIEQFQICVATSTVKLRRYNNSALMTERFANSARAFYNLQNERNRN